ncbi:MAG: SUMF1/EgtB/PvdO family nonheme iron enzyme [Luteimonas sp.]|nr:SUMF1/EgtB/PvdO family nonheme iron enzyme [Luteimonas sp.]
MAIQHAQNPLPKLPPQLRHWQRFMDKALAKSPRKRFHDAQQMSRALDALPLRPLGGDAGTLGTLWQRGLAALRRLPRLAWVGLVLLAAAATGLLLHQPDRAPDGVADRASDVPFAPPTSPAGDGPAAAAAVAGTAAETSSDPSSAMHRAAPQSETDRLLLQMRRQVERGRLVAPEDDHAVASLLAAWRADREHLQLPQATTGLFDALGDAAARAIADGHAAQAEPLLRAANRLAQEIGAPAVQAQRAFRDGVAKALLARSRQSAGRVDRTEALRLVALARLAGLPAATVERLAAQAVRIPDLAGRSAGNLEGMLLVEDGRHVLAAFRAPVSRADYARFASAAGRAPALCRERASLLRVLAPRDWSAPGFEQSDADPVVCVSWQDAQAYAQWLGQRDGQRYRLATAAEAARLPAQAGERSVAEWRDDCSEGCARRAATGASWRSRQASRALDPARGYDDVGFRLVRDL